jgi:hypothetical protein
MVKRLYSVGGILEWLSGKSCMVSLGRRGIRIGGEMKTKCAYCKDPIYDFQAKVIVGKEKLHRGCLHVLADANKSLYRGEIGAEVRRHNILYSVSEPPLWRG